MRGLTGAAIVSVLIIGAMAMYYSTSSSDSGPELIHTIARGQLVVAVTEKGTLESANNSEIKCKVRGYSTVTWVIPSGTLVEPGDDLVLLDTKRIEDEIGKHTIDAHLARATFERTKADVARADLAIDAYLNGRYLARLNALNKQLEIAQETMKDADEMLTDSEAMFRQGYVTKLELEARRFTVTQASLELKIRETAIHVLNKYTKEMELETLRGNLRSLKSKFEADKAGLAMDEGRRDRAIEELGYCEVNAERSGLVIYPMSAEWKDSPDIAEGATVRKDQVFLLMPDLTRMQVKIGIHESLIDRISKGLPANVTIPEMTVSAKVASVASVARPAGWWTGSAVKYDAVIELPPIDGLKPGMSAEVEVEVARYEDVLTIPVSAIVETADQNLCWVKTGKNIQQRSIVLGDSNDVFIVVESGLKEGEQVVLNPLRFVEEAKGEAIQELDRFPDDDSMAEDFEASNIGTVSEMTE